VSPLPGPSGNVEFFLWLKRGEATVGDEEITAVVRRGTDDVTAPDERLDP
jgi:23S rRNA (cytidine1920-2'-O)/16S rRNA (cytidine1409-2'-O)-methyltransferase